MTARVLSMLAMLAALWLPAGLPAAWGQAPPGSTAPSKAPPAPTATEKPAPQSIPVPEVARRADDIGKELRDLETLAVPSPAIGAIEKRLPEITAQIVGQTETSSRLLDDAQPVAATLDGIATQWQATRAELAGYVTDRKSTRLNSSHQIISYAVFCLKKKKKKKKNKKNTKR